MCQIILASLFAMAVMALAVLPGVQCLLQNEQMFWPPVALEAAGDAMVFERSQLWGSRRTDDK
jgi:hypothetical protein